METVRKRSGTFTEVSAGDWMNHLSIVVYQELTLANLINEPGNVVGEC